MNINDRDATGLPQRFIMINKKLGSYVTAIMQAKRGRKSVVVDVDADIQCHTDLQRKNEINFQFESCYHILKVLNKYTTEVLAANQQVTEISPYIYYP